MQSIDVRPEQADWSKAVVRTLRTYQTGLDGGFAIPKVTPGTYYVVVQQAGYLSPVTQFTRAELQQPTPELLAKVLKVVPVVTVEANRVSNIETRIERGPAISGTIRYDDGSPMVDAQVTVLGRETKAGKSVWGSSLYNFRARTNDQGQFRVTSLPAGEYLLRVRLEIEDMIVDGVLGSSGHSSSSNTRYQLHYFYGDTPRQDQGKPMKLQPGEQQDAADITVPIGKLHTVAGTLTNGRSGQVVNEGKLTLKFSDGAELVSTKVDPEDNTFRFDFVPEGEYTLAVTGAKDVARESIPSRAGVLELPQTRDTTLREYRDTSQPLIVQSDVSGLVVQVPPKTAKQTAAAQQIIVSPEEFMRSAFPVLLLCSSCAFGQSAQKVPAAPPVYGVVAGRITCVDTNQPARLASVTLQTINVKPDPVAGPNTPMMPLGKMMRTYQTTLDGTFLIAKVVPGIYYVVIQAPGYISPITQFTQSELQQPTAEILARIVKVVPTVTVTANQTATLETRIERGAEFSGTIRYDDGTPVGGTYVNVLSKETKDGKNAWVSNHNGNSTDDRGYFRITGLPKGEYLLEVDLRVYETYVSNVLGGSRSSMNNSRYGLSFYSGDVARKDKGKSIKLDAGEQRDSADITIPVSKLHRVAGTLTEQHSGHVINDGKVTLKFGDGVELSSTTVDPEDSTFHFDFVPEGEYTLAVSDARDVWREEVPTPPGGMPSLHTKDTTVREYGSMSQPLIVQSDVSGLAVPVPPKASKAGTAQ